VDWTGFVEIKRGLDCRRRACDAAHSRPDAVFTAGGTHCSTRDHIDAHNKSTALAALKSRSAVQNLTQRTDISARGCTLRSVPNVVHMALKCVR